MRVAVVDFETTGLLDQKSTDWAKQPGIVQMGVSVMDNDTNAPGFQFIRHINMFVDPEIAAWDESAIKAHGIKPEQCQGQATFFSAFHTLAGAVNSCDTWVGYNLKFDKSVLWYQLLRYGYERNFPWPQNEIEVMELVAKKLGFVAGKRHDYWKLGAAYHAITGKDPVNAHDAMGDVAMTAELFNLLWRP